MKIHIFLSVLLFTLGVNSEHQKNSTTRHDPEIVFKLLKTIFKFSSYYDNEFDRQSFKIIEPKDKKEWKNILTTKQCIATAKSKTLNKTLTLKFIPTSTIASSYDFTKQKIVCNFKKQNLNFNTSLPTEHYVNSLVNDQKQFLTYYPGKSMKTYRSSQNFTYIIFVNDFITNATDLEHWSKQLKDKTYELKLRTVFMKVYKALGVLANLDFIYTDLKPSNILLDVKGEPYLINLGSVVKETNSHICVSTEKYHPPDLLDANVKIQWGDYLERIRTWTFCSNVYYAVCKQEETANGVKFAEWLKQDKSYLDFFGCRNKGVSRDFKDLIGMCLVKNNDQVKFDDLKKIKWLQ